MQYFQLMAKCGHITLRWHMMMRKMLKCCNVWLENELRILFKYLTVLCRKDKERFFIFEHFIPKFDLVFWEMLQVCLRAMSIQDMGGHDSAHIPFFCCLKFYLFTITLCPCFAIFYVLSPFMALHNFLLTLYHSTLSLFCHPFTEQTI